MRTETQPPPVRLSDYAPPAFLVDETVLTFRLDPTATRVTARLTLRPNPARAADAAHDLRLDGRQLELISAAIDGQALPQNLRPDAEGLTVPAELLPDGPFVLETVPR